MINTFDNKELFNENVKPLLDQAMIEASKYKIPIFYSAAIENTESGTVYKNDMLSARDCDVELTDDHLIKHANVFNGFDTVLKASVIDEAEYDSYAKR